MIFSAVDFSGADSSAELSRAGLNKATENAVAGSEGSCSPRDFAWVSAGQKTC